jgi:ribosomal protein S26
MHHQNPTLRHSHVKAFRCSNCGDVMPATAPPSRPYCAPCCFPMVRKLRARAPRKVRPSYRGAP